MIVSLLFRLALFNLDSAPKGAFLCRLRTYRWSRATTLNITMLALLRLA